MKITSKRQFLRLWEEGTFGNKPNTWRKIDEAEQSGFAGEVALRYAGSLNKAPHLVMASVSSLRAAMEELKAQGWQEKDFFVSEVIPAPLYAINGEVIALPEGLFLTYSTVPALMRESLRLGAKNVSGLTAKIVLSTLLEPQDLDYLHEILASYPEHAVEFSGLGQPVGSLKRRLIIWEVRFY
jgi:hypothetical protein